MKVYINDEEVLCNRNLVINQAISEPNSVILNNVYPKSWENDRDYVSRFYMPKDYSPVNIINDNEDTIQYDITNNIRSIKNKAVWVTGSTRRIEYHTGYGINYIRIIPGYSYTLKLKNNSSTAYYALYQTTSLNINELATWVVSLAPQTSQTITITPTKEYLVINSSNNDPFYIEDVKVSVTNNLIFSGLIKNSGNINLNPRYPHYSTLQALDYSTLLSEGDMLNYVLEGMKISEVITKIVTDQKGFMVGAIEIDNDEILAPYNCNEKTTYDVLQYIAEITGAKWYTKTISKDIVLINFYMPDKLPEAVNIEYNNEHFIENKIDNITYSYNVKDYRNKQVITSDDAIADIPQVEYLTYMGSDLKLTYNIGKVFSITNGTTSYSYTNSIGKTNGVYADFYYNYGNDSIEVNKKFNTGTTFKIEYYPIVNARLTSYNQVEIDRISETTGREGLIVRYEKRTDTNDENSLAQIAQTYLDYKGVPEIILKIQTHKDIFEIGNSVFFVAPINDLSTKYLVKSKQINMTITGDQQEIFYTYELSSSFNDETAINFFDNQRRKLEGNIEAGEYITRYIDLSSQTNIIFYGLTAEEIEIETNTLDSELEVEL